MKNLPELAESFRAMHLERPILVVPNAWDVVSARIFARRPECRALATTSSGVAATLGYPDGEKISREEMLAAVARITTSVDVPVTADLEAGYGDAGATVRQALEAGAVGLNLEDGTTDSDQALVAREAHAERIVDARAAASEAGVSIVINARTDSYLRGLDDYADTVARGNAYLAAGADCVFVPGVADADLIGRLARAIKGPVNILAGPGSPGTGDLERLGVARVTLGSGAMRATAALVARVAAELYEDGTYAELEGAMSYRELNDLLGS